MDRIFARVGRVIVLTMAVVTLVTVSTVESAAAKSAALTPRPVPTSQTGIAYGPEPHQLLDLRLPDPATYPGLRPVIVYAHSGGWIGGDRTNVPDVLLAQVGRGYAVATVEYLLATTVADGPAVGAFPGAIWDVKRAIRFLKANAPTWNLDPGRVVLAGGSAGGYLAAFTGATAGLFEPPDLRPTTNQLRDSSVTAVVDIVGPSNLVSFERTDNVWAAPLAAAFLGCVAPSETNPLSCPDDILDTASVWPYVDGGDPPIFMAYGADDGLVVATTQGEPLARVWVDAHNGQTGSVVYDVVQGAGHNLPFDDTITPISNFLDRVSLTQGRAAGL